MPLYQALGLPPTQLGTVFAVGSNDAPSGNNDIMDTFIGVAEFMWFSHKDTPTLDHFTSAMQTKAAPDTHQVRANHKGYTAADNATPTATTTPVGIHLVCGRSTHLMALENVDPNRGLIQKPLPHGGPLISMCRDVPGIYFDANGHRVSDEMAAKAGFDVEGDRTKKLKAEAKKKALDKIDAQFAEEAAKVDQMTDSELEEASGAASGTLASGNSDEAPFVEKNAAGEPRVARTVPGGPVKEMKFDPKASDKKKAWAVVERESGAVLDSELPKGDATEVLLAD